MTSATLGALLQASANSDPQSTASSWRDFAPYVVATIGLLTFVVTRYVEVRQKKSQVFEEYAAMAQEVAHALAEAWRTWPRANPFSLTGQNQWTKAVSDIDGRLTPLLRKVEIIGSKKSVSAAYAVRNAINGLRDAIEFGVEVRESDGRRQYIRPPEETYLVKRWFKERGCEKAYRPGLGLWWERPPHQESATGDIAGESFRIAKLVEENSEPRADVSNTASVTEEDKHLKGAGWLIVWGNWQGARKEFIKTARNQVGPWWTKNRFKRTAGQRGKTGSGQD